MKIFFSIDFLSEEKTSTLVTIVEEEEQEQEVQSVGQDGGEVEHHGAEKPHPQVSCMYTEINASNHKTPRLSALGHILFV